MSRSIDGDPFRTLWAHHHHITMGGQIPKMFCSSTSACVLSMGGLMLILAAKPWWYHCLALFVELHTTTLNGCESATSQAVWPQMERATKTDVGGLSQEINTAFDTSLSPPYCLCQTLLGSYYTPVTCARQWWYLPLRWQDSAEYPVWCSFSCTGNPRSTTGRPAVNGGGSCRFHSQ